MNLVETPRILMLSDSPGAKVSTEYVGAKPSSRISHCACCCRGYFGLFENPILSPISQNASLLCLHFWLSGEMRGTNFSEILAAVEHNWTGVGYCPQCLVLGGHLRNAQVGGTRPTVVTLHLGDDPMCLSLGGQMVCRNVISHHFCFGKFWSYRAERAQCLRSKLTLSNIDKWFWELQRVR